MMASARRALTGGTFLTGVDYGVTLRQDYRKSVQSHAPDTSIISLFMDKLEPISRFIAELPANPHDHSFQAALSPSAIAAIARESPQWFLRRYFWKNAFKCLIALEIYLPHLSKSITQVTDLGCGPGTFFHTMLSIQDGVRIIGLDFNKEQLVLARQLATYLGTTDSILLDVRIPEQIEHLSGLCTASYLYTELDEKQREAFADLVLRHEQAEFLVVDYIDEIQDLRRRLLGQRPLRPAYIDMQVPVELQEKVNDTRVQFGVLHVSDCWREPGA